MIELKPLHPQAIPAALEKAHRYRLLNEPVEAESICRDVLDVDPNNQAALVTLVLALSDQLGRHMSGIVERAREAIRRLPEEYDRHYYTGVLYERQAKAHFRRGGPGSGVGVYEWLMQAMEEFEAAETLRPPDNDDAVLRWNACARFINRHPMVAPEADVPGARHHFLE